MIPYILLLLLSQQPANTTAKEQPAPAGGQPVAGQPVPGQPAQEQPEEDSPHMKGNLRVELLALGENRVRYLENPPGRRSASQLNLQLRLAGEKLAEIVKVGNVIFESAKDDSGQSLIGPETFTEDYLKEIRSIPTGSVLRDGLVMAAKLEAPARKAGKIAELKGKVHTVMGTGSDEVTIEAPLRFQGKVLEDAALARLGIEVKMLAPDDLPPAQRTERMIALRFTKGENRVRSVDFYDGWMKKMMARTTPATTVNGETCTTYRINAAIGEDTQMVLTVFEKVEEIDVPVNMKDVELP